MYLKYSRGISGWNQGFTPFEVGTVTDILPWMQQMKHCQRGGNISCRRDRTSLFLYGYSNSTQGNELSCDIILMALQLTEYDSDLKESCRKRNMINIIAEILDKKLEILGYKTTVMCMEQHACVFSA